MHSSLGSCESAGRGRGGRRQDRATAAAGALAGKPPSYPGTAYVLLHSLSHAPITEIALDCGYPASSLKERVYALTSGPSGPPDRCGILIYTATAGAQGTLGGLVGTAPRIARILANALDRSSICSNDPVCADHEPDDRSGDRATHGAGEETVTALAAGCGQQAGPVAELRGGTGVSRLFRLLQVHAGDLRRHVARKLCAG